MRSLYMILSLVLACSVSVAHAQNTQEVKTQKLECDSSDGKTLKVAGLESQLSLPNFKAGEKYSCEKIEFKSAQFIGVRYETKELVTYTGKYRPVVRYDVFQVEKGKLKYHMGVPVKDLSTIWALEHDYPVLRIAKIEKNGEKDLLEGYVFNTATNSFTDLTTFAIEKKWK